MNYLVKKSNCHYFVQLIAIFLILMLSVFIADKTQTIKYSTIAKILVIMVIFILYFVFNEITILRLLVPFTFVYLRPANYLFYFYVILIFMVFILIRIWKRNLKLTFPYFSLFTIVFFFGLIAIYKETVLSEGIHNFFTVVLTPIILITVIYNSDFSYKDMVKYLKYLVIIATIVGFIGIIIAIMNPTERIGSTWKTAMTINAFYIFNFFISLGLAFREKDINQKILFYFCSLIILFGMLFTYTRISLLSVAFGGLLLAIRLKEVRKYAIVMFLLLMIFIPASMVERAGTNIFEDPSIIIRLFAWIHSYDLFLEHPVFGIGFDTWKNTYRNFVPMEWMSAEHPHNVFIKILLELGLFGMIAYFSIIISIIWKFYKVIKRSIEPEFHLSIIVATVAVLFSCLTDVFIVKIPITVFFWIMLAFMLKMTNDDVLNEKITGI